MLPASGRRLSRGSSVRRCEFPGEGAGNGDLIRARLEASSGGARQEIPASRLQVPPRQRTASLVNVELILLFRFCTYPMRIGYDIEE